jgi:TetR/AcrR family transcriptional regulator, transcriptional repressor for nem operon
MQATTTKERLLAAGQRLMLERSFQAVGLTELLEEVNVPKGSFYHHFGSKEQFGVELVRDYLQRANENRRQMLLRVELEPDPMLRLSAYLDSLVGKVLAGDGYCPCLAAKLASEVCGLSDAMRTVFHEEGQQTVGIFTAVLDEAVARKQLPASVPTASWASAMQDLLLGALQRCGVTRTAQPLRDAILLLKNLFSTR